MSPQVNLSPSQSPLLRPFYPALDGLRAVAFLMVFLQHYYTETLKVPYFSRMLVWGWTGVDLFFVLSGFLITGILYDSLESEHFFKNFYIRRALRIFPLFYGIWILALILTPVIHVHWSIYNAYMAAYCANLNLLSFSHTPASSSAILFAARHAGGPERTIFVGHLWSLCVEEQFYLVWPAIVCLIRSRKNLLCFSLVVVFATLVLRVLYAPHHPASELYLVTFFRMDALLLGAALALWLRGKTLETSTIRRSATATVVVAIALLAVGYLFTKHNVPTALNPFVCTYGYSLIAIACAAIILLAIDAGSPLTRVLQKRPLLFLGRISYGLYVIHMLPYGFVVQLEIHLRPSHLEALAPVLALVGTVTAAWLSFRFYETPFLRLKSVLAPRADITPAPVIAVPASLPLQPIAGAMRTAA